MSHLIKCHLCSAQMSMSDEIFARRIAGRRVTLKCKHCGSMMVVDGTTRNEGGELRSVPAKTTPATASAPDSAQATPAFSANGAGVPEPPAPSSPTAAPAIAKPDQMSAQRTLGTASPPAPRIATPAPAPSQGAVGTPTQMPAQRAAAASAQVPALGPPRPTSTSRMIALSVEAPAPVAVAPTATAPVRNLTPIGLRLEVPAPPGVRTVRRPLPPPVPARASKRDDMHALSPAAPLLSPEQAAKSPTRDASTAAAEAPARAAPEIQPAASSPQLAPDAEAFPLANAPTHDLGAERELTPGGFAVPSAATPSPRSSDAFQPSPVVQPRSKSRRAGRTLAVIAAAVACAGIALVVTKKISLPGPTRSVTKTAAESVKLEHAAPALALATTNEATANHARTPEAPSEQVPSAVAPAASDLAPRPPSVPVGTSQPAPEAPTPSASARDGAEQDIPSYAPAPALLHLTEVALHRAQDCHRSGRAVGNAEVFITFTPNGRVSEARVEGEPIASAPVAKCIKDQALAIVIPQFDGAPFTISRPIVLR